MRQEHGHIGLQKQIVAKMMPLHPLQALSKCQREKRGNYAAGIALRYRSAGIDDAAGIALSILTILIP